MIPLYLWKLSLLNLEMFMRLSLMLFLILSLSYWILEVSIWILELSSFNRVLYLLFSPSYSLFFLWISSIRTLELNFLSLTMLLPRSACEERVFSLFFSFSISFNNLSFYFFNSLFCFSTSFGSSYTELAI